MAEEGYVLWALDRADSRKQKFSHADCETSDDETETMDKQFNGIWAPQHVISILTKPGTTRRCTSIIILLSSGTWIWIVRIFETGKELELSMKWPKSLTSVSIMFKKWLDSAKTDRIEPYHLKVVGMEAALKTICKHTSGAITSTARFLLPFTMQHHLSEKHFLIVERSCLLQCSPTYMKNIF